MGRKTLEEKVVNYIRNAVDLSVGNTGYPVLGRYLEEAGIATRKQLRAMERKGLLKSIHIVENRGNRKGTMYVGYYTERDIPAWVTKQQEAKKEVASES